MSQCHSSLAYTSGYRAIMGPKYVKYVGFLQIAS